VSSPGSPDPFAGMTIGQAEAAAARKQLEALAEHSRDPRIKEMARDVLAGKLDLRAAMLGPRYEDALNEGMAAFSERYRNMSEGERAEEVRRAGEYLEQLRQDAAAEQAGVRRRRPRVADDDWEPPSSIYGKPGPR
jgi:hypothetical protein